MEITCPLTSLVPTYLYAVLFQKGIKISHNVTQSTLKAQTHAAQEQEPGHKNETRNDKKMQIVTPIRLL